MIGGDGGCTVTATVWVRVVLPFAFVAVNTTENDPSVVNVCDGLCEVDVPLSPKFHPHDVGE
jgi:hypothetical protein